ncbi:MAG: VWA domain-containing protein, partial [Nitrospinota bacterium]|nr:VWA domain-containing protein [Nitrospinota bacterium]
GEEAYEEFSKARQGLMDKLAQALEATGQVEQDEDDGVFKLTPAAARKVGETTLAQIYSRLKNDGAGGHYTTQAGEGSLEQVKTRPFEYGDSITHLDLPASMVKALVRGGCSFPINLRMEDMEIHETRGVARNNVATLIDMSGSMSRFGRFYNAKKMALALDSLIRSKYPEDSVSLIGFATFARKLPVSAILELSAEPITFWGGGVNMKVNMGQQDGRGAMAHVPRYFTNIQKALELARISLTAQQGKNKQIILITDGAPTAWYEGESLNLSYPPTEKGYSATLREARACAREGISINVFMLGNDFDMGYFGEGRFLNRFMETTRGRIFYPNPDSLTEYVLADYLTQRRRIVEF